MIEPPASLGDLANLRGLAVRRNQLSGPHDHHDCHSNPYDHPHTQRHGYSDPHTHCRGNRCAHRNPDRQPNARHLPALPPADRAPLTRTG